MCCPPRPFSTRLVKPRLEEFRGIPAHESAPAPAASVSVALWASVSACAPPVAEKQWSSKCRPSRVPTAEAIDDAVPAGRARMCRQTRLQKNRNSSNGQFQSYPRGRGCRAAKTQGGMTTWLASERGSILQALPSARTSSANQRAKRDARG